VRSFSSIISSEPATARSNANEATRPTAPTAKKEDGPTTSSTTQPEQDHDQQPSKVDKIIDQVIDHAPQRIQEAAVGRDDTTEEQHNASNDATKNTAAIQEANGTPKKQEPEAEKINERPTSAALSTAPSAAPSTAATEKRGGIWGSIRRHISLRK
jgi:hypothetical protein